MKKIAKKLQKLEKLGMVYPKITIYSDGTGFLSRGVKFDKKNIVFSFYSKKGMMQKLDLTIKELKNGKN